MGNDLNRTNDNLAFTLLFKRPELWPLDQHISEIWQAMETFFKAEYFRIPLDENDLRLIDHVVTINSLQHPAIWLEKRRSKLLEHRSNPQKPFQWGWKEPNTHIFLPALMDCVPGIKYVHVMRHGLDMANSKNQSQVNLWGKFLLEEMGNGPKAEESFRYWCAVHRRVMELTRNLNNRFLLLNFDDFCSQPETELKKLLNFLEVTVTDKGFEDLVRIVDPPASLGRYKNKAPIAASASDIELLKQLGYQYY